jgi:hypothetical protein
MSKKSKRQTSAAPMAAVPAAPAPTFGGLQRKGETAEFNPDYTNVKHDLKRIGILAGSIFTVLIALSFLMPYIMPYLEPFFTK